MHKTHKNEIVMWRLWHETGAFKYLNADALCLTFVLGSQGSRGATHTVAVGFL